MSHFIGFCFGDNYEEYLEQYSEELEVEPYIEYTKEEAIDKAKAEHVEAYGKAMVMVEEGKELPEYYQNIWNHGIGLTYDEAWEICKEWGYEIDENTEDLLSTYNPNSKWDWYTEGGRWNAPLILKDGNTAIYATVGEVDWDKTMIPFCFTSPDGEWFEKGEMGWWCMVDGEKSEDDWKQEFKSFLKYLDEDTTVVAIDFHI